MNNAKPTTQTMVEHIRDIDSAYPRLLRPNYYAAAYASAVEAGTAEILTDSYVLFEMPDFGCWFFDFIKSKSTRTNEHEYGAVTGRWYAPLEQLNRE